MSKQNFDLLGRLVALVTTISQFWGVLVDFAEKLNSENGESWAREFAKFLRKEPTWTRRWREEIYFDVASDGTTGPQWIARLEAKGFRLSKWAKDLLNSKEFQPTSGVTYQIAVIRGTRFSDDDRITSKIRDEAERRGWAKPNPEVACLIREMFSDEELEAMGLWWIVVFHEPIEDSDGDPRLLATNRVGVGRWLSAFYVRPGDNWNSEDGFAFAVSQVS